MKNFLNHHLLLPVAAILFAIIFQSCGNKMQTSSLADIQHQDYITENVVIVVIDGPRYEDTWGMKQQPNIPKMANELLPQGTFFTNFQNNRRTITVAGHTAITTGNYEAISNDGSELPEEPSFLHRYLKQFSKPPSKAAIITSKDKLNVLAKTEDADWQKQFFPYTNNGINGKDRKDVETFKEAIKILATNQPNIALVQFKGPDTYGHANDWNGYVESIRETDSLVFELWQYLQQDDYYKGKTSLLITNDHGRHSTGHKDGFGAHGDNCEGCKHISLLALGPDFSKGKLVTEEYELIDIAPTIGGLLGFEVPAYDEATFILPLLEKDASNTFSLNKQALEKKQFLDNS